jgi:hypothetical protein
MGARQPCFSSDGQRIGFITAGRELKVASLGGEPPLTLLDTGLVRGGGSWSDDGYIYFTRGAVVGGTGVTLGLGRVPAVGGAPEIVSELDSARAEVGHMFPDALPNGRGVLFTISRERLYGGRAALAITEGSETQMWIKRLDQGPLSKLSFEGTVSGRANWHPDGQSLVFRLIRGENSDLYSRRADGSAPTELLMDDELDLTEVLYSPDGEWLVYRRGLDLFAQRVGSDEAPLALAAGEFAELQPAISPDGRWLAFATDEAGRDEVYVHPFPNTADARWQVSSDGGLEPVWAHSGRELFYRSLDEQLISVDVLPGSTFIAGDRRALFSVQPFASSVQSRFYDVAPDDERFVMARPVADEGLGQMVVVEHFLEELRRRIAN